MNLESNQSRVSYIKFAALRTNWPLRFLFAISLAFLTIVWASSFKNISGILHSGNDVQKIGNDLRKVLEWSEEDVDSCKPLIIRALLNWKLLPDRFNDLTLVIYHLGSDNTGISYGIQRDNIATFTSALKYSDPAFYIFQVLGGRAQNSFKRLLPTHLKDHMCIIDYYKTPYDVSAHMVTLWSLGPLVNKFHSVLMLNHGVRGPLTHRDNGQWLSAFSNMLNVSKVAIAGSRINCAKPVPGQPAFVKNENMPPHVQTHAFALRTSVLPIVIAYQLSISAKDLQSVANYINYAEVGMSGFLRIHGYKMASLEALNYSKKNAAGMYPEYTMHSRKSFSFAQCDMDPLRSKESLIFYKFGGNAAYQSCNLGNFSEIVNWLDYMLLSETVKNLTLQLKSNEPKIGLKATFKYCREASNDAVLFDFKKAFKVLGG